MLGEEECQCGHGLAGFEGVRYQKGFGLLSSLFAKVLPYLKQFGSYVGKNLLSLGSNVADDVVQGKSIKESAKQRLKQTASKVLDDGMNKIQSLLQNGNGRRKRQVGLGKRRKTRRVVNRKKKSVRKAKGKKRVVKKNKKKTCRKIKRKLNKRKATPQVESLSFLA